MGKMLPLLTLFVALNLRAQSEYSVAHLWSEDLLYCIRHDFARPPIHARNLHHLSLVMHDAFAAYNPGSKTILLNNTWNGFSTPFFGVEIPNDVQAAQETAISYAAYRLLKHRFQNAPGVTTIYGQLNNRMSQLGHNPNFTSTDYVTHGAPALGNYLAQQMISYGLQDGSNEIANYANTYYTNGNPVIEPELPGNPNMVNPNRFQRISLSTAFDQAGNPVFGAPPALAPEWGNVKPFSLKESESEILVRDGQFYKVYNTPNHPPYLDTNVQTGIEDFFKWNFLMVSVWQSHLDTLDNVMWDVSPGGIGNVSMSQYPDAWTEYPSFYNFFDGGDIGTGHTVNPITGLPYEPQLVRRGDYARVLAEFWADGLDSETPPGHWFDIYNKVSNHPLFERKWKGQGDELSQLEYDIRAYMLLGGAMHDAAITAWAVKGYFDYLRPVSAIRFMGDRGQSSDPSLPNYHPAGLPLIPGFVELVDEFDPLVGDNLEHLNKIKLYTWRGHDYVEDIETEIAGVGWILCENWWPYQRPTFVTPPFAGYVSGHSTFSRAAANVMHFMTGNEFFPGGMSNFIAEQNDFLEFEVGPSQTVILQWATYYDASDQCSLSRIWGGIHPPVDDIAGRKLGQQVGIHASNAADSLVNLQVPKIVDLLLSTDTINHQNINQIWTLSATYNMPMNQTVMPQVVFPNNSSVSDLLILQDQTWLNSTTFVCTFQIADEIFEFGMVPFSVIQGEGDNGYKQSPELRINELFIDTKKPEILSFTWSQEFINAQTSSICATITFSESCNSSIIPVFEFSGLSNIENVLLFNPALSNWVDDLTYMACFDVNNQGIEEFANISGVVSNVFDNFNNPNGDNSFADNLIFDTQLPQITLTASNQLLNLFDIGSNAQTLTLTSNKAMSTAQLPTLTYTNNQGVIEVLETNLLSSSWTDVNTCVLSVNLLSTPLDWSSVNVGITDVFDTNENSPNTVEFIDVFSLDTKRPEIGSVNSPFAFINDAVVGNGIFEMVITFDESMNQTSFTPLVSLRNSANAALPGVSYNVFQSSWDDALNYRAKFNVLDQNLEVEDLQVQVSVARDLSNNPMTLVTIPISIILDTRNPNLIDFEISNNQLNQTSDVVEITSIFDEAMHPDFVPNYIALNQSTEIELFTPLDGTWIDASTYQGTYQVNHFYFQGNLDVKPKFARDEASNLLKDTLINNALAVDFIYLNLDDNNSTAFQIYPNPIRSGAQLNLVVNQDIADDLSFKIFDYSGRLVDQGIVDKSSLSVSLPREFSSGLYILTITSNNQTQSIQFQIID